MSAAPTTKMFPRLTLRARLYLIIGFSVAALLGFAAAAMYASIQGAQSLSTVFLHEVQPTAVLVDIDQTLKEIQFRMAAYLLDQLPAVGNRNQLHDAESELPAAWAHFKGQIRMQELSTEQRALVERIDRNLPALDAFFRRLDRAYDQDNKRLVSTLLAEDWPFAVQATVLKPIDNLIPLQRSLVKTIYSHHAALAEQLIMTSLVLAPAMVLTLLLLVARFSRGIVRSLAVAVDTANRVADGNFGGVLAPSGDDEIGALLRAIAHMHDEVRDRESRLTATQQRLATILHNAAEGVVTFDTWGVIDSFNQSAERLFGYRAEEILGKTIAHLIPPESGEQREDYLEHFLRTRIAQLVGREGEVSARRRDGSVFPMAIKVTEITLEGRPMYTALLADISERRAMMERLKTLAERDGLTGLYNRSYFLEELERAVERTRRTRRSHGLLHIDLDNFKYANDTLGHAAGDRLLHETAAVLRRRARNSDFLARLGGDEFTVLLYDVDAEQAALAAECFRQVLAEHRFCHDGTYVDVGCSIGVALITHEISGASEVLAYADMACHLAKRAGRNQVHVFGPVDKGKLGALTLDMGWSQRIKEAVEQDRFVLAYQPIVDTRTRRLAALEVLVRLRDTQGEIILPSAFMPTAERFGLATDIDLWVIRHALAAIDARRDRFPGARYHVNLSAQSLGRAEVYELIRTELAAHRIDPASVVFEVTETAAIGDMTVAAAFLAKLQEIGCRTALDDFGTGVASIEYLQELPVDVVKIAGRFVRNAASSVIDSVMVRSLNEIAHALGKETVAEFVEDEATLRRLAELEVDYAQGYHIGRPELDENTGAPKETLPSDSVAPKPRQLPGPSDPGATVISASDPTPATRSPELKDPGEAATDS